MNLNLVVAYDSVVRVSDELGLSRFCGEVDFGLPRKRLFNNNGRNLDMMVLAKSGRVGFIGESIFLRGVCDKFEQRNKVTEQNHEQHKESHVASSVVDENYERAALIHSTLWMGKLTLFHLSLSWKLQRFGGTCPSPSILRHHGTFSRKSTPFLCVVLVIRDPRIILALTWMQC